MEFYLSNILRLLSKKKYLQTFEAIAHKGNVEGQVLKYTNGYTQKQYYTATEKLIKYGLIKRRSRLFSLTSFGAIIYHHNSKIDAAINEHHALKAIDSIRGSKEERERVMKILINDTIKNNDIKRILSRYN
jgi:hypothetical protein